MCHTNYQIAETVQIKNKGENEDLFKVTKQEADYVRRNSKNVRTAITGKQKKSKRKRWYVDESAETFMLLEQFWDGRNVEAYIPKSLRKECSRSL